MLPEIDVHVRKDPSILAEDDFRSGPSGWTQLLNGNVGAGVVYLDSEITAEGSPYSLLIGTGEQSSIAEGCQGYAAAVKRLSRGTNSGRIYAMWKFAYGSLAGENHPKLIDFGIDQADPDGTRRFFKVRWLNYDETGGSRVSKFQVYGSAAQDVPGAAIDLGYNENKRNLWTIEAVFNLSTGKYEGLAVNGDGFGSLADTPDTSLSDLNGPSSGSLPQFAGGLNGVVEVYNRLNTTGYPCWVNLAYFKAVAL